MQKSANPAEREYRASLAHTEEPKTIKDVLFQVPITQSKKAYKPPYSRCKLACKFHNGRKKYFYSYDYNPRIELHDDLGTERVLDEGHGIRALIELANKYHNKDLLQFATLYINLTPDTYTEHSNYDFALGSWAQGYSRKLQEYKLIQHQRELEVEKPVTALVETIIDLDYLAQYSLKLSY